MGYEDDLNLYAYVRNDPLNNSDPLGLYTCNGGSECPDYINQAVADINTVANQTDDLEARDAAAPLAAALGNLGDAGVDIVLGAPTTDGAPADAHADENGNITIRVGPGTNEGWGKHSGLRVDVAGIIGHETRHGLDDRERGSRASTVDEVRQTERNAYRDQILLQNALSSPPLSVGPNWNNFSAHGATVDDQAADMAEDSVARWLNDIRSR